jgi:NADH-quinone oxidoreductase subunit J
MSLILFIIMFLNIQDKDLPLDPKRWYYLAGAIVVVAPIAGLLLKITRSLPAVEATVLEDGFGSVKDVGQLLFRDWLLPFEIVSILLLVALVGAVVLAGKREE